MKPRSEEDAKTLIDEHLRSRGWNLTDFSKIRKEYPTPARRPVDYIFFDKNGKPIAILEAKKPGKDLYGSLEQAKDYAKEFQDDGVDISLIFSSDGKTFLKKNLKARTLPERINQFPTPEEFYEIIHPEIERIMISLRPYQKVAVSQVISSFVSGREKMYIQMATGTGKTAVAAAIIAKLLTIGKIKKVLFMVDRDSLATQTVNKLNEYGLGEYWEIKRLTTNPSDRYADILVSTVQMLATGDKFTLYPNDFFDLIILDECHRSYFGDWHKVVEYFRKGDKKAVILGLTATPSDKETVNTDRYFGPPVFRYTYRQAVKDDILADTIYYKFQTNVDLYGIHELGFDFDPEDLGRAVDVPQRNELIAEKYFEVINFEKEKKLKKALVFAASIKHANNLRYAFIRKYNELMGLPPDDAEAEDFIVAIHTGMPNAKDLIREFQRINGRIKIAVSIDMLSTGIDAPDIEVLVMARPTKSKVLYAQMKGRGARKCEETGKDKFILIDFVDSWAIEEEVITNEILEEEEETQYEEISEKPLVVKEKTEEYMVKVQREVKRKEMIVLDVPVWIEYSEVIEPQIINQITKQIQHQVRNASDRITLKSKFQQALISWQYFKGDEPVSEEYLKAMGFDLETLRDIYGEPEANLKDFIEVALGRKSFPTPEERKRESLRKWLIDEKQIPEEGVDFIMIYVDFKNRNPELTLSQYMRSRIVDLKGGLIKIEEIFGSLENFKDLAEEAFRRWNNG
ncbi:MAG: DEAD/DEAH box helicase family protein [Candidatus Marinimicrobia bacterium]|nr:DEAD/DEAH box helicase family protein [Candidatus Neomarinimicrobiota bacterium]